MTAVATRTRYLHAHHGIAEVVSDDEWRFVRGEAVRAVRLAAPAIPTWNALVENDPNLGVVSSAFETSVLASALGGEQSPWITCPQFDVGQFVATVAGLDDAVWCDSVHTPGPNRMLERCQEHLSRVTRSEKTVQHMLAILVSQVCDYLVMWRVNGLMSDEGVRPRSRDDYVTALGYGSKSWTAVTVAPMVGMSTVREMSDMLAVATTIVATGAGEEPSHVAALLDDALTARTLREIGHLSKKAEASREAAARMRRNRVVPSN